MKLFNSRPQFSSKYEICSQHFVFATAGCKISGCGQTSSISRLSFYIRNYTFTLIINSINIFHTFYHLLEPFAKKFFHSNFSRHCSNSTPVTICPSCRKQNREFSSFLLRIYSNEIFCMCEMSRQEFANFSRWVAKL